MNDIPILISVLWQLKVSVKCLKRPKTSKKRFPAETANTFATKASLWPRRSCGHGCGRGGNYSQHKSETNRKDNARSDHMNPKPDAHVSPTFPTPLPPKDLRGF